MTILERNIFILLGTLFLSAMLFHGCGTSTKITGAWSEYPGRTFDFDKIAVIGISKRAEGRKIVEEEISDMILKTGNYSVGGLDFLPPQANEENLPLDILLGFIKSEGADAVLTVSLMRTKDSKQYTTGSYYYVPWTDARFGDYYGQMRNYLYAPGYTTVSTTFFLESNLYSFPEGEMLWSIQTASSDVTDIRKGSQSLAKAVVTQLLKDQVIVDKK